MNIKQMLYAVDVKGVLTFFDDHADAVLFAQRSGVDTWNSIRCGEAHYKNWSILKTADLKQMQEAVTAGRKVLTEVRNSAVAVPAPLAEKLKTLSTAVGMEEPSFWTTLKPSAYGLSPKELEEVSAAMEALEQRWKACQHPHTNCHADLPCPHCGYGYGP